MGNLISSIDAKVQSVPRRMAEQQRDMMLKQREVQLAMQLAGAKDRMQWIGSFMATYGVLVGGAVRRGRSSPAALGPLLPLSFVLGWHYDIVYGNKLDRMRIEAERILREDAARLQVPAGNLLVSPEDYSRVFIQGRTTTYNK